MNKNITYLFLLSFLFIVSCVKTKLEESAYEKQCRIENEENSTFKYTIFEKYSNLIDDFSAGKISTKDKFGQTNAGFYCVWKYDTGGVYPHSYLNTKFREDGYNVTTNLDSLKYLIVSERVLHAVGFYNNGGLAQKQEVIISIIDLNSYIAYTLKKVMGGDPPHTIQVRSKNSTTGASGERFSDSQIFDFLTTKIILRM